MTGRYQNKGKICKYPECDGHAEKREWCSAHYRIWRLYGEEGLRPLIKRVEMECAVDGCDKPFKCKGYCDTHYNHWKRLGHPTKPKGYREYKWSDCSVEGCLGRVSRTTLCRKHSVSDRYATKRLEALMYYGQCCVCCGEKNYKFLTFDHINNDGNVQRRVRTGNSLINYILREKPNDLQLLCFNCNCAKGAYGVCPHESKDQ